MRIKTVILSALLLPFAYAGNAQNNLTLQPDATLGKDAVLHGLASEANVNYGTQPQHPACSWTFGGSPGTTRGIMEFDISSIPVGATVTNAFMSLFAWNSATGLGPHSMLGGSNAGWLLRITSPWDESTVAWDTSPSTVPDNSISISSTSDPAQDYVIDVTALVQDMVDNPTTSFGFMLRLDEEVAHRTLNFASSDHEDSKKHPKLEINYTGPIGENPDAIAETETITSSFKMYPNPANRVLNIEMAQSNATGSFVQIINEQGQIVKSITGVNGTLQIDVADVAAGFYHVTVQNGEGTAHKKLVIR